MEEQQSHRIGFIRIPQMLWMQKQDAIKTCLGQDGEILDVVQAVRDGSYLAAVDVIMVNPEFEEVPANNDPLVRYECLMTSNGDGTVSRGKMEKIEAETSADSPVN